MEDLDQQLSTFPLFGGDLIAVVDLLVYASVAMDTPNGERGLEVAGKCVRSLSSLLEQRSAPAWRDLPNDAVRRKTGLKLVGVAEAVGVALVGTMPKAAGNAMSVESDNICKWKMRLRNLVC